MNKLFLKCLTITLFFLCTVSSAATALNFLPDHSGLAEIIVKFNSPTNLTSAKQQIANFRAVSGLPVESVKELPFNMWLYSVNAPQLKAQVSSKLTYAKLINNAVQQLNALPQVKFATQNQMYQLIKPVVATHPSVSPPNYTQADQWNMFDAPAGINARCPTFPQCIGTAWNITQGNPNIVVGILDTGTTPNTEVEFTDGWNFVENSRDTTDITPVAPNSNRLYHGEHVAGIIAAKGPTVFGVGPNLTLFSANIFGDTNTTSDATILKALAWSVALPTADNSIPTNLHPANVLNLSIGQYAPCSAAMQDGISSVLSRGATIIVAAGNFSINAGGVSPANCLGAISVAATESNGLRAFTYSDYGQSISLAAPGGDFFAAILSTSSEAYPQGLLYLSGTSMSTPHVSGVAGLLYSLKNFPANSTARDQVETLLAATTHPFAQNDNALINCLGDQSCGAGILDAANAVNAVSAQKSIGVGAALSIQDLQLSSVSATGIACPPGKVIPTATIITKRLSNSSVMTWRLTQASCAKQCDYQIKHTTALASVGNVTAMFGYHAASYEGSMAGYTCVSINKNTKVGCLQQ